MKKIRSNKKYILLKDEETNLYTIVRIKDKKQTSPQTKEAVEACILDEGFTSECKLFDYV